MPKVIRDNSGIQLSPLCIVTERSNIEGTYHLKENGVLVTDKKDGAEIFDNYFSLRPGLNVAFYMCRIELPN